MGAVTPGLESIHATASWAMLTPLRFAISSTFAMMSVVDWFLYGMYLQVPGASRQHLHPSIISSPLAGSYAPVTLTARRLGGGRARE